MSREERVISVAFEVYSRWVEYFRDYAGTWHSKWILLQAVVIKYQFFRIDF